MVRFPGGKTPQQKLKEKIYREKKEMEERVKKIERRVKKHKKAYYKKLEKEK